MVTLHDVAAIVVRTATDEWLDSKYSNKGVYLRAAILGDSPDGDGIWMHQFFEYWIGGDVNRGDEAKLRAFSAEKLLRLRKHFKEGHLSAFQSAIDDLTYAGAIRFGAVIPALGDRNLLQVAFSVSGLPAMADEAIAADLAWCMSQRGWEVEQKDLRKVLTLRKNPVYRGHLLAA